MSSILNNPEVKSRLQRVAQQAAGIERNGRWCACSSLYILSGIALVVIASITAAGVLSATTAGYSVIGLAGGNFISAVLVNKNFKARKWDIITIGLITATSIAIGALTVTGTINVLAAGCSILGGIFVIIIVCKVVRKCDPAEQELKKRVEIAVALETLKILNNDVEMSKEEQEEFIRDYENKNDYTD